MSDLVGNPEDRFSHVAAHLLTESFPFFQIYKNLYGAMIQGPKALERPEYWREFADKPVIGRLRSNL